MKNLSTGQNRKAYLRAYKIAHKDRENALRKKRYWKNPEFFRLKNRLQYRKAKAAGFDFAGKALRTRWGLSWEDYRNLLFLQGSVCAICGTSNPKSRGIFSIDHNHATGKIRGLLCTPCNIGVGHAQDNIAILREAIAYLNRYAAISNPVLDYSENLLKC